VDVPRVVRSDRSDWRPLPGRRRIAGRRLAVWGISDGAAPMLTVDDSIWLSTPGWSTRHARCRGPPRKAEVLGRSGDPHPRGTPAIRIEPDGWPARAALGVTVTCWTPRASGVNERSAQSLAMDLMAGRCPPGLSSQTAGSQNPVQSIWSALTSRPSCRRRAPSGSSQLDSDHDLAHVAK